MSIFDKLSTQVKGLIHDALDSASDDGRTARQLIRDLGENEAKVKEALVEAKAQEILIQGKADAQKEAIKVAERRSVRAVETNNTELARSILVDKKTATETLAVYESQLKTLGEVVGTLTSRLTEFGAKRSSMERQSEMLDVRSKVAKATNDVSDLLNVGLGSDSGAAAFERLEEKVSKQEAIAKVKSDMVNSTKSREQQLAELDSVDPSIDDELAALVAKSKENK